MNIVKDQSEVITEPSVSVDELAVQQVRQGNKQAFETIMRRHNQRLYRVARSILRDNDTAEDAVQQAYIVAYHKLHQYVKSISFGAWLTRIVTNEALMMKRKPDNRYITLDNSLDNVAVNSSSAKPHTVHANNELAGLIESAIEQLPEDFRLVFVLREIQQLSVRETATSLEINEATVKSRLHRARGIMQNILNQHIEKAGMHVYEFAGQRCDRMVNAVLTSLLEVSGMSENNLL